MAKAEITLDASTHKAAMDASQLFEPQTLEMAKSTLQPVDHLPTSTNPLLKSLLNSASSSSNTPVQVPLPPTVTPPLPAGGGANNPLDQLKDIHLPEPVTFFPNAPGWWLLVIVSLALVGYFIYRHYRYKHLIALIKPATQEVENLKKSTPSASSLAQLSALLKRISLVYFPKAQVASLKGKQWLKFLNQDSQDPSKEQVTFGKNDGFMLTQLAYQKNPQIDPTDWRNLLHLSQRWINNIVQQQARKKLKGEK